MGWLGNYQVIQNYTYWVGKEKSKHLEEEKIHQFLMGLELDLYNTAWSNILSLESLPTLNNIYAFIAREEWQQAIARGMDNHDSLEGAVFKATVSTNRRNWRTNSPRNLGQTWCSHCHKLGHEKKQYYELVGYPPNWGNRRNAGPNQERGKSNLKLWSNMEVEKKLGKAMMVQVLAWVDKEEVRRF